MPDKFRVTVTKGLWKNPWPDYFDNFYRYCQNKAKQNRWNIETTVNHELRPLGGRLIVTKTQGWYLRWDRESSHTVFVLKWS
jgi:hypothetical protein